MVVDSPVRVVCMSDTFSQHPDVPMGDIVIHAGNISAVGTREDIQVQLDWLKGLPHKHKIYVCGNTNYWFDQFTRLPEDVDSPGLLDIGPIYVLKDAYASLKCGERLINVYGAAHFPVADGTYRPCVPLHVEPSFKWSCHLSLISHLGLHTLAMGISGE